MKIKQKIKSEKTILKGKVFDVKKLQVELPDGREKTYDVAVSPDACAILAMDDDNVTMIEQYRPSAKRVLLEIPAGKIDEGEQPIDCALRELREETGLVAQKAELMFEMFMSPGFLTEKIYVFRASNLTQSDTDFDDDEFIKTVRIPLEKAKEMIKDGEIEDAKTIAAIMATT